MISVHFEREGNMGMGTRGKLGSEVVGQYTSSNWEGPVQGLCADQSCLLKN